MGRELTVASTDGKRLLTEASSRAENLQHEHRGWLRSGMVSKELAARGDPVAALLHDRSRAFSDGYERLVSRYLRSDHRRASERGLVLGCLTEERETMA